jgi:hypothetical protein
MQLVSNVFLFLIKKKPFSVQKEWCLGVLVLASHHGETTNGV